MAHNKTRIIQDHQTQRLINYPRLIGNIIYHEGMMQKQKAQVNVLFFSEQNLPLLNARPSFIKLYSVFNLNFYYTCQRAKYFKHVRVNLGDIKYTRFSLSKKIKVKLSCTVRILNNYKIILHCKKCQSITITGILLFIVDIHTIEYE